MSFCLLVTQWIHPGKVGVYRFIWSSSFSAKWNYVVVMLSFAYWNNLPQFTFFGECPPYFYFARIVSPWTNTVSPGVSSNWTEQEKQRKIIWSNLTSFITYSIPRLVTEINVEPLCMCLTHKRQWASISLHCSKNKAGITYCILLWTLSSGKPVKFCN